MVRMERCSISNALFCPSCEIRGIQISATRTVEASHGYGIDAVAIFDADGILMLHEP